MLEQLDTIVTIRLHNWKDASLKQKFITHLETIPQAVTFRCVQDDLYLRYDGNDYVKVFYATWQDYARNSPIVFAGIDFESSRNLDRNDVEQLNLKALIHLEGAF